MKVSGRNRGFTLIELIVVIAILATLVALAMPAFSGVLENSKIQVAESNARTVYTAAQSYYVLNGGEYPYGSSDGEEGAPISRIGNDTLYELLGSGFAGTAEAYCADGRVLAAQWYDDGICVVYDIQGDRFYTGTDGEYTGRLGYADGRIIVGNAYLQ